MILDFNSRGLIINTEAYQNASCVKAVWEPDQERKNKAERAKCSASKLVCDHIWYPVVASQKYLCVGGKYNKNSLTTITWTGDTDSIIFA